MDERGFTLVELLVGMTVLVIVMLATLMVLDDSTQLAQRENERTSSIREAQVGLDRMVRELRHTRLVNAADAQSLDVNVLQRGVDRRVVFNCGVAHPDGGGLRRCTRTADGATTVLIDRVRDIGSDSSAFAYTPTVGPRHVSVRLGVAVDGGKRGGSTRSFVLTNGTKLRNVP